MNTYDDFLRYFDARELVSPEAYNKYKNFGSYFFLSRFDIRLIETMLWIRETTQSAIIINTWHRNGRFDERGLRDTSTPMVQNKASIDDPYLSAHVLGKAFDYDIAHQTPVEHREWLKSRENDLPHKIRLERNLRGQPISWVHLDVCDDPKNSKVYEFDV